MKDVKLKLVRDKCLLFNKFLIENCSMPSSLFHETNLLIEKAYIDGNVKVLKSAERDIEQQMRHMSLHQLLELKVLYKKMLSVDCEVLDNVYIKSILKIIKNGKIRDDFEYELLLNRVDEIFDDQARSNEILQINKMLISYQNEKNII